MQAAKTAKIVFCVTPRGVESDIFVGSSGNQSPYEWTTRTTGSRGTVVYYADPKAMLLAASSTTRKAVTECDYNIYFLAANQEPQIRGVGSLSEWKKLDSDWHSLVVDPQFVDVENGDYRLHPESPAFSLGFQPLPLNRIGPRSKAVSHDAR
jgi:hypothetical protein